MVSEIKKAPKIWSLNLFLAEVAETEYEHLWVLN